MNITQNVDSWGKKEPWTVEVDFVTVFTATTRKACKAWVIAQGKKPVFVRGRVIKQH
jgi:hypothetical protein